MNLLLARPTERNEESTRGMHTDTMYTIIMLKHPNAPRLAVYDAFASN